MRNHLRPLESVLAPAAPAMATENEVATAAGATCEAQGWASRAPQLATAARNRLTRRRSNSANQGLSQQNHCDSAAQQQQSRAAIQSPPPPASALMLTMHNKSKLESRRKAAKMLTAIVVLFGICYLPVHLINFLRQFIDDIPQTDVTSTISMLSHCVCYLNSAINPIIYNHMNSVFRAEFRKFLSCLDWLYQKPPPPQKQQQQQQQKQPPAQVKQQLQAQR